MYLKIKIATALLLVLATALLVSATASAQDETWTLLPKLTVTPPESLDVTFQSAEELDLEGDYIWGWKGEEADYFVMPTEWEKGFSGALAWKVLLLSAKLDSENEDFEIIDKGDYQTNAGYEVDYRLVKYLSEGDEVVQSYASVENTNGAFMLIGTSFSGDEKYLLKSMKVLASNTRISK